MGVVDNTHDLTIAQLLQKKIFKGIIQVLGTGVGKDFDITKLRYDKVIICSDSDTDGYNITSLLLCFFFTFMPELIKEGKVYKAMPPLYLMDTQSLRKYYSGREWLYNKNEYYDMINTIIADNIDIALELEKKDHKTKQPEVYPLSKKEAVRWLTDSSEYKLELDNLGKKSACDPRIIEMVCYYKTIAKDNFEFKKLIEKEFPEMNYDVNTYSLIGAVDGEFVSLICDGLFDKSATRFMVELLKHPTPFIWYKNHKNDSDKFEKTTIGSFMAMTDKLFDLKIDQRYKG